MLLTDYLVNESAVWESTPIRAWDDVEQVFRDPTDLDEVLRATISLCAGRVDIDPAHTELLSSSPLAAWVLAELFDYELLKASPLTLYRACMQAEQLAAENTTIAQVAALNFHGLARLYQDQLGDYVKRLEYVEKFLEVTDPHPWRSIDFPMASYVLDAAVEYAYGPIGPFGERVMSTYEDRIIRAIESVHPDAAYTELQLLSIWKEEHS